MAPKFLEKTKIVFDSIGTLRLPLGAQCEPRDEALEPASAPQGERIHRGRVPLHRALGCVPGY